MVHPNNEDKLISVLMCSYNDKLEYLELAVNSILNQTYGNLEFIIVNDGTDDDAVNAYLNGLVNYDNRVKVITNDSNLGLTKSLNVGMNACKGTYIARMDSDDYSYPSRLAIEAEYLDSHPDVALVGSCINLFETDIEQARYAPYEERFLDRAVYEMNLLFDHVGPAHPSFMFRGNFIGEHSIWYREDILKAQDYAIKVDVLKSGGHIAILREPLIAYRIHDGQISTKSRINQINYHKIISSEYIKYQFPELSQKQSEVLSTIIYDGYEYEVREYVKAIKELIKLNHVRSLYDEKNFKELIEEYWVRKVINSAGRHQGYCGLISGYSIVNILRYWKLVKELV